MQDFMQVKIRPFFSCDRAGQTLMGLQLHMCVLSVFFSENAFCFPSMAYLLTIAAFMLSYSDGWFSDSSATSQAHN